MDLTKPKQRYRPRRSARETVLAEWRGIWEPQDLSKYDHEMGSVVNAALKGMGLEERFAEEQVFAAWSRLVSPLLAQHARPVAIERKVLHIQVLHSSIYYEVERMKGQILARMQQEFGATNIRAVRFRLG